MTPATGLYVHWPFCARICPYCDFTVAKARSEDQEAWRRAFAADLDHWFERTGRRDLVSVYFGGGTPSLMTPALIAGVIEDAGRRFGLAKDAEITIEANPNDVTRSALADWAAAGINRMSLGVQSFDDAQLKFLGRDHDANQARAAVGWMLDAFERSTFDLIYALPGEGVPAWTARLNDALASGVTHLSLYQLTVEPGTAFSRAVDRGDWSPPAEGLGADLYEATAATASAAGLPPYEVSSHARPGAEAVHNGLYWRGADWIAIGPGAHGRLTVPAGRLATEGTRAIGRYLTLSPAERLTSSVLSEDDVVTETVAGGLRLTDGLAAERLGSFREAVLAAAEPLVADGLVGFADERLFATQSGRLVLDAVTAELLSRL